MPPRGSVDEGLPAGRNGSVTTRQWLRTAPTVAWLAAILALALLLRLAFFVGLASGDPQDDGVYYGNALALYENGPRYLGLYRGVAPDFIANPIDQFNVRPMVTYPIAALFVAFGPGEIQASSWALFCSLLIVLVVYWLGDLLHGRSVGLTAALLCAVYPLEVINGTRILSDVQVGLFASLGLLCFVAARRVSNPLLYVAAGAAAAGAYLANGRGLLFALALIGTSLCLAVGRKLSARSALSVAAGFLIVFSVEAVVYYTTTGHALLSYHVQSSASYFKYLHEPVSSVRIGPVHVDFTNGRPLDLVRSALAIDGAPTNQVGLFFYLFGAAIVFSLVRRQNLLLAGLAIAIFVSMEFGPLRVDVDWSSREIHYLMLFKQQRFLLMLTAPLVVMAAYFFCAVGRKSAPAAALLTTMLLATALPAIVHTREYYRSGLVDLRAAATEVRLNPDRMFFGDLWAILHLRIFTHYRATNLTVLNRDDPPERVNNGCVILGGSRGVELQAEYVESTLPGFARDMLARGTALAGWQQIREIRGARSPLRAHDLKIYCAGERRDTSE